MTTFKEISGQLIRTLSSDPANPQEGQIWYNSTIGVLKGSQVLPAAWASGGNLPIGLNGSAGAGTQTAGLSFAGVNPPTASTKNATNEYNGSSWTAGGNMNTGRFYLFGNGSPTAGLGFGGYIGGNSTATEEYNGTSWTSVTSMPLANRNGASDGPQTATISFGGISNTTFLYDGTNWTTTTALPSSRNSLGGCGTQTAALAFGGAPSFLSTTDSFNGSTWTSVSGLNTGRQQLAGSGIQTLALAFGGNIYQPSGPQVNSQTSSEEYDGSTWTTLSATLGTARYNHARAGTGTTALAMTGGNQPQNPVPWLVSTEEFTGVFVGTKTLTTS